MPGIIYVFCHKELRMKTLLVVLLAFTVSIAGAQSVIKDSSARGLLLAQLKETQEDQQWFVPLSTAIKDLTPEQASWKPDDSSHSIVQLVTHLTFWNLRALNGFRGLPNASFDGNNDETFANLQPGRWNAIVARMDSVSQAWETAIASAKNLSAANLQLIARLSTHNAYHTGQILYIRKQQHAWDSRRGVK